MLAIALLFGSRLGRAQKRDVTTRQHPRNLLRRKNAEGLVSTALPAKAFRKAGSDSAEPRPSVIKRTGECARSRMAAWVWPRLLADIPRSVTVNTAMVLGPSPCEGGANARITGILGPTV